MMAILYALAIIVLLAYGGNLLLLSVRQVQADSLRSGLPPDPEEPPSPPASWPVVTVQLPLYNEAHVAERLIDACAKLDYPRRRLEIQVLDDSTDETTERVARRVAHWQAQGLDITHIRRERRDGYKAGALRNGLPLARGDFIAIFDADFVPPPDFLRRLVPHFEDPDVGMVQARWGHLNDEASLLTRLQALGLDMHFATEQWARSRSGFFINFNGTAGIWRRQCIEDAGGWQTDTLTEDLDLSYRAQLAGWQFRFVPEAEAPAELPADMGGLRAQQFRWTKGGVETARKLLGRLWRADVPWRTKMQGTMHLTAYFVYPFLLVVAALHAPLLALSKTGGGPSAGYFALMSLGLVGFAGFTLAVVLAQRALYPDWKRRLRDFPLYVAGSMGIALSNTRAVWQALRGRAASFTRTPKYNASAERENAWWRSPYAARRLPPLVWGELGAALYSIGGLIVLLVVGAWTALPFQGLFAAGFGMLALSSIRHVRRAQRAA